MGMDRRKGLDWIEAMDYINNRPPASSWLMVGSTPV